MYTAPPLFRPFSRLCFFVVFLLISGSLLAALLAPFGVMFVAFWLKLGPFWCHVGPDFGYFAPSGVRFGSLWAKLTF